MKICAKTPFIAIKLLSFPPFFENISSLLSACSLQKGAFFLFFNKITQNSTTIFNNFFLPFLL